MSEKFEVTSLIDHYDENKDAESDAEEWEKLDNDGDALVAELREENLLPKPLSHSPSKTDVAGKTEKIDLKKEGLSTNFIPGDDDTPVWADEDENDALLSALNKGNKK